jgi:membrane fusion protein (multidrug efflux system)
VKYVLAVFGLLVVIGALASVKFTQISSLIRMGKAMQQAGPPPESVGTSVAEEQSWEGTLSAVGTITAVRGVTLSNDAPGVVSHIFFESGAFVHEGQVLVELDTAVERAQLASADARRELAQLTASRSRALVEKAALAPAQLDTDNAQLKTSSTDLNAIQAQIDRKVVRAPFAGRLGIREVNLGQYLNSGTELTVLEAIDSVYADFSLPQEHLQDVKVGMPVRVAVDAVPGPPRDGVIAAIDPAVDATTRSIKLRATVPNKEEKLRPGMFVTVSVILPTRAKTVSIPATAVVHAAYGDSVFIVEDGKSASPGAAPGKVARQQFVKVGEARGDYVAILDGVKPADEVVTSGAFKLRNGAGIVVDNSVKPTTQLDPHPENR